MHHLVLAEDDPLVASGLAYAIRDEGVDVSLADDGLKALAIVRSSTVDLLLTDLFMPRLSGRKLIEIVQVEWPRLPIIAMTGYLVLGQDDVFRSYRAKGIPILEKPMRLDNLMDEIRVQLRR